MSPKSEIVPSTEPSRQAIRDLLTSAGFTEDFRCTPCSGGANNRTYRIETAGKSLLLKWYFGHPEDPRDRLQAEFAFAQFAWEHGITSVPEPLASASENRLGLYEFIAGTQPAVEEITAERIEAAVDLFRELNRHRDDSSATALPAASEACFSINAHLECVSSRVSRLSTIEINFPIDEEARQFVRGELEPNWRSAEQLVRSQSEIALLDKQLSRQERCLSPSDFGYHNAIITTDGAVRFIDFEYAGWDDPAKLVCDFFTQVQVPVPDRYFDHVVASIGSAMSQVDSLPARVESLLPLYRIKWCCIILNEFLPTAASRRDFSVLGENLVERKGRQLQKARRILDRLRGD